jgi:hypothetical protein
MIFTFPAIFYTQFFPNPVARPSENGNLSSSKRGENKESNKIKEIKNSNDLTKK